MESGLKEFPLHCEGNEAYVEVSESDNLSDVRKIIVDELDEHQLPGDGDPDGFFFKIGKRQISVKQEARKNAFALLEENAKVELVSMVESKKRKAEHVNASSNKRPEVCLSAVGFRQDANVARVPVTPTKEGKSTEDDAELTMLKSPPESLKKAYALDDVSNKRTEVCLPAEGSGHYANVARATVTPTKDGKSSEDDAELSILKSPPESLKRAYDFDDADDLGIAYNRKTASSFIDLFGVDGSGNDSDSDILEVTVANKDHLTTHTNPCKEIEKAKETSHQVLSELTKILQDNPNFCTDTRRTEWLKDIENLSGKSFPQTIVGVLGSTGVGKSSLLNALLDESDVLPTSGSRGCTATVVELMFHSELTKEANRHQQIPVYKGIVELITLEDWKKELKVLLEECSVEKKRIHASHLQGDNTAWQRIEKVYGKGALAQYHRSSADTVFQALANITNIDHLIKATDDPAIPCVALEDWKEELKVLVDSCSTKEKLVEPQQESMESWQKLEQVYGKRFFQQYRLHQSDTVFQNLASDPRVQTLLTSTEPGQDYNSITVEIGEVVAGSDDARDLLKNHRHMTPATKNNKAKWAREFRQKINSYVYTSGDSDQPQTWPLIRKVSLKGPWHVLSTGAVLVDLPGIKDSNVARGKVAEKYIENCNNIAIVVPIKRAVNDGTARDLLGEQFKRRLLMDGQYGNVFFVCTQTDSIEPTEAMREHEDIACRVPGRLEKMTELEIAISELKSKINDKLEIREDLKSQINNAKHKYKETLAALNGCGASLKANRSKTYADMRADLSTYRDTVTTGEQLLADWQSSSRPIIEELQQKSRELLLKLKPLCAAVRNEYSKAKLQEDFRSGLIELYEDHEDSSGNMETVLPDDSSLDVFCVSANDYLKSMRIKSAGDGLPLTFFNPSQTQIPLLQSFVHELTARNRKSAFVAFTENTHDLLDQVQLLAADVGNVPKSLLKKAFKVLQLMLNPLQNASKRPLTKRSRNHSRPL